MRRRQLTVAYTSKELTAASTESTVPQIPELLFQTVHWTLGLRCLEAVSCLATPPDVFRPQYVLESPLPQWAFGHGISYTSFDWTDFALSKTNASAGDIVEVSLTVHNNGSFPAKEVVQVRSSGQSSGTII